MWEALKFSYALLGFSSVMVTQKNSVRPRNYRQQKTMMSKSSGQQSRVSTQDRGDLGDPRSKLNYSEEIWTLVSDI